MISQFSISDDISETRYRQYCKFHSGTNIDIVVDEISNCDITAVYDSITARRKTGRTKYFEKAYIQTFSHNSLNFGWGAAACQTERFHLFYCINGDWMYLNLHVDNNQEKSGRSNLVAGLWVFFEDVKFNKNKTLYRTRPTIWEAAKSCRIY